MRLRRSTSVQASCGAEHVEQGCGEFDCAKESLEIRCSLLRRSLCQIRPATIGERRRGEASSVWRRAELQNRGWHWSAPG